MDSDGLYKISDLGKEAIRAVKSLESSFKAKEAYPPPQSRYILGALLILLSTFMFAVTIMALTITPLNMTSQQLIGLLGGLIGSIVGMLGASLGLKAAITADAKSSFQITYFPSRKNPWTAGDRVANLLSFSSYLTLMFLLIYAQVLSTDFLYKPLWFTIGILALSTSFTTSVMISYRIIEKANRKIEAGK